jgi:crossover junction endodeoxyribonuclease RuvC
MVILGLDPGSVNSGYGVVDKSGSEVRLIEVGTLSCPARRPLPLRLARMSAELGALVDRHQPALAVLEAPFHGLNVRSLVVLAQARGALLAALGGRDIEIREYSPAEVKLAVTGNGRAGKDQVARMVRLLLGLEGEWSSDATDALAVALCAAHRFKADGILALHGRRK